MKDELLQIKSYLGERWFKCGVVFENDPKRIEVYIDEKDYDNLDDWFQTSTTGIVNLAVFFNIQLMRHLKSYKLFESNQNWSEVDGKLCRDFQFSDFNEALQFINKISEICESENHHPEINWIYNKITLKLSTHDAGDIITEKDIKLAELIDEVA